MPALAFPEQAERLTSSETQRDLDGHFKTGREAAEDGESRNQKLFRALILQNITGKMSDAAASKKPETPKEGNAGGGGGGNNKGPRKDGPMRGSPAGGGPMRGSPGGRGRGGRGSPMGGGGNFRGRGGGGGGTPRGGKHPESSLGLSFYFSLYGG